MRRINCLRWSLTGMECDAKKWKSLVRLMNLILTFVHSKQIEVRLKTPQLHYCHPICRLTTSLLMKLILMMSSGKFLILKTEIAKMRKRGRRGIPPLKPLLPRPSEHRISPRHTARVIEGRTPKEKHPFLFQKKFHPRQIRNARRVYSF